MNRSHQRAAQCLLTNRSRVSPTPDHTPGRYRSSCSLLISPTQEQLGLNSQANVLIVNEITRTRRPPVSGCFCLTLFLRDAAVPSGVFAGRSCSVVSCMTSCDYTTVQLSILLWIASHSLQVKATTTGSMGPFCSIALAHACTYLGLRWSGVAGSGTELLALVTLAIFLSVDWFILPPQDVRFLAALRPHEMWSGLYECPLPNPGTCEDVTFHGKRHLADPYWRATIN